MSFFSRFKQWFFLSLPQRIIDYFGWLDGVGEHHLPREGGALLLGNSSSEWDWIILQLASKRPIRIFVRRKKIPKHWFVRRMLRIYRATIIDDTSHDLAINKIRQALLKGGLVCVFPESHRSSNGYLNEFHPDFMRMVEGMEIPIIPFYIRGLWLNVQNQKKQVRYSSLRQKLRALNVVFGEKLSPITTPDQLKQTVVKLSIIAWQRFAQRLEPIPNTWLRMAKHFGHKLALADSTGLELSNYRLITAVYTFRHAFKKIIGDEPCVGVLVPPSAGGVITNLALLSLGRTVVNLNYTAGANNIHYAIEKANIKTVITSSQVIEKLESRGFCIVAGLSKVQCHYLEEIKAQLSRITLFKNFLIVRFSPVWWLTRLMITSVAINDIAAVMFSSGSEGTPKGAMLSHQNILANIYQLATVANIHQRIRVLGVLPIFHSFGFTVTTLLPLLLGSPLICHPDPTDVVTVAKLIHHYQLNLMCGTSTLFRLYLRNPKITSPMLASIQLAMAGAEKLAIKVQTAFYHKFKVFIYEGYGTTEISPVASANLPNTVDEDEWQEFVASKVGTVGIPIPGTMIRIVDPETLQDLPVGEAGMVFIGGPQVMVGYLNDPEKTASVLIKKDDITWYKTGDKGYLDKDGFLTIVDRYSRFAKIAGEMVSLTAVEQRIAQVIDEGVEIVAMSVPSDRKGEIIVLLYVGKLKKEEIIAKIKASSEIPHIMQPTEIFKIKSIPKLGSGKMDYVAAQTLLMKCLKKPR